MITRIRLSMAVCCMSFVLCIINGAFVTATAVYAQNAPAAGAAEAEEPKIPGLSELVPQASALGEALKRLQVDLSNKEYSEELNKRLQGLEERIKSLKDRYEEVKASHGYGFDQIMEVRSTARNIFDGLGENLLSTTDRLNRLDGLKKEWQQKESQWENWRKVLSGENKSVQKIFQDAHTAISTALKEIGITEGPLIELQKNITSLQNELQLIIRESDGLIKSIRKDIFRKSSPSILSQDFVSQFNDSLWVEFRQGITNLTWPERTFFAKYGWIIFLQLIFALSIIFGLMNLKHKDLNQVRWQFVLCRPIAAGIFIGVSAFFPFYTDIPSLWRLILWSAIVISGARLTAEVVQLVWRRRLIYFLAMLFLLSQFFLLSSFPAPLLRLYTLAVSLAGSIICFWRANENRKNASSLIFALGLWTGGGTLVVVFLAQIIGYSGFANHLLDATIKTIFLGLFGWLMSLVWRGGFQALLTNPISMRNALLKRHSPLLLRRTEKLTDILVIFFTGAGILTVWGIYDSPGHAISSILAFGITIGERTISLGLVATAATLLFGSLFISWLIQRILAEEVYPRRNVQHGVGVSINRILQYIFVLIGALIALSALGVHLQNLTVILGALGIGIGFGLQNIVNNFASGIILLFERPIKMGDIVEINGEWGQIKNLGLRATVVETFDQSELIVPNSDFISTTVTNWTLSDRKTRVKVAVGIAYGSDVPLAMSLLKQVANDHEEVLKNPEPAVLFRAFGASSLDFELRAWIANVDSRFIIMSDLHKEIDHRFREAKVEIAFPQQDLHIRTVDESVRKALLSITQKTERRGGQKQEPAGE